VNKQLERVQAALNHYPAGVHLLRPPARANAVAPLPAAVAAWYRLANGGTLFHETLTLYPVEHIVRSEGRWAVGELDREPILVDDAGAVWRSDPDTGDAVHEGTQFDAWLDGFVAAEALLYDESGEFRDFVFEEDGQRLTPAAELARQRQAHSRDKTAAGPWWRLARALQRVGQIDQAQDELELLVAEHPAFGWAWFDLARISEAKGQLDSAVDEAEEAAATDPEYEHAPYFLACAARMARRAGDHDRCRDLAQKALSRAPDLARQQRDGAVECLHEGDIDAAEELIATALALAPGDVEALALAQQIRARRDTPP
jgi:hypothetical protein